MGSVTNSGTAEITHQLEYDDEVAYEANRKIYDLSRGHDERPWCLTVSFTHPHDPYLARKKYWDLYENCDHLLPEVSALSYPEHDPHSKRILDASDWKNFNISEKDIKVPVAPILQTFHILMIRSAKFWIPYKKQIRKQLLFLFLIMGICLGNAAYGLR